MERPGELQEVVGHSRLQANVQSILQRIERDLDHADARIGESMHVLDLDNDGLVRGGGRCTVSCEVPFHRRFWSAPPTIFCRLLDRFSDLVALHGALARARGPAFGAAWARLGGDLASCSRWHYITS